MTIGDLTGVLPFENNLFVVEITGAQLKSQLAIDGPVVAGVTWKYKKKGDVREVVTIVDRKGKQLEDGRKYKVIINDFMYLGGDGFQFKDLDATPVDTGLSLREPVLRMFRRATATNRAVNAPVGAPRRADPLSKRSKAKRAAAAGRVAP